MRSALTAIWLLGACAAPQHAAPSPAPTPTRTPTPATTATPTAPPVTTAPPTLPTGPEAVLITGQPTETTFADLIAAATSYTPERRAALAKLGSTPAAPIRVPSIRYEYVWVANLACVGGAGQVGMQSLINNAGRELDELQFKCPGESGDRAAFFDFSADPTENAMKQELGLDK